MKSAYYSHMPPTDTDAELLDAVLGVARHLRRGMVGGLEPLGVTPHQARALRVIATHEPLRLGELAEALHIAPRSATEVVDSLEELGFASRGRDVTDRRAVVVSSTAAGRGVLRRVDRARHRHATKVFSAMSSRERTELLRLLRLLQPEEPR